MTVSCSYYFPCQFCSVHLVFVQVVKGNDSTGPKVLNVMARGVSSIPAITSFRHVNSTSFVLSTRIPVNYFDFEADSASINVEGTLTMDLKGGAEARQLQVTGVESKNRHLQSADVIDDQAAFGVSINLEPSEFDGEDDTAVVMSGAKVTDVLVGLVPVVILVMRMVW